MNVTNKTVLITGGGSGIGFEIAKQLIALGNTVIITGRNEAKLKAAAAQLKNATYFAADVTNAADTLALKTYLETKYGGLDILINNAGSAHYYQLGEGADAAVKAAEELQTNFVSVVRLTEELLPLLAQRAAAAIVNVSSIVAFVPSKNIPTYSASKAALHSYTQSLRLALGGSNIKVFELMPPLVNTEFSSAIGGENGIPPSEVADSLIKGFENDEVEIRVGVTEAIYQLTRSNYAEAFTALNSRGE